MMDIDREIDSRKTAEDIFHDLLMKLWESRETIVITKSLNAYLNSGVHNSCLKHIEHLKVRREYYDIVLAENSEASDSNNPMSMLIAKETEIERAINALPAPYRKIIDIIRQEELSYEQIAKNLGIPVNSVGSQLTRARKMLLKSLENKA